MAALGSDERDAASSSKKTRRPVIRSISWKRSKKTKMEEADNHSVEESVEVDSGRRFAKREGSHEISDYEDDEVSDVDPSGPSSKKRKRFGMWKVVKRFFGRKSGKGSKSFTEGESSTSKSQPARSLSDPNLMRRIDRPELAPFEQVDKQPLQTKPLPPVPKKALSHDSLMSELRLKQTKTSGNEKELETSPRNQRKAALVSPETQAVDWQVSPSSHPERLVPGLSVSHDKIRVAPRHRRAPTRRGVASQRHAERDIPDGSFIPRSNSARATSSANLAKEQQVPTEFKELMQSLRAREEENETYENGTEVMENELKSDTSLEQKYASGKIEIKEVVFDSNEIAESTNRDITNEGVNASRSQVHEFTKLEANTEEDKTSMDSRSDILPVTASENETEVLEKNTQLTAEEVLKERKSSNQDSNNLVEFSVSLPETVVAPVFEIITDPESKLNGERAHDDKPGDDIGIFPEEITELTPDTDPEPSCEVIAEQASVEFLEPDPNIIPESASEPVTDESNEVTSLSGTVSGPVRQKFDNAGNVPEQVPPKAESEQITAPSLSSDQERPQPSLTLPNDAIPGGVSGPSQEAFMEAASQSASDHIPGTVSESVLPEFVELKKVPEQVILVTGFEQKTDPSLSSDLESFKLNPTLPNEDINIQESKLIKSSSAKVVATSPARSKRLTIEMPENVFQKPIMQELSTKENSNEEKSDECNEMHKRRTQSVGISKVEKIHDGEDSSEDDHTAGVAKLTQVFERSSRAKSFSHAERRKKPDVLPKPNIPAPKPGEEKTWSSTRSRSLGRNYCAPVTAEKSVEKSPETGSGKSEERITVGRANDIMIIVDPETLEKHKSEVAATTTKKGGKSGKSAPKPLPKPKLRKESKPEVDLKTNRDVFVLNGEGKENLKKESVPEPVRNGSAKMSEEKSVMESENSKRNIGEENKDGTSEVALPSFWARRNMFTSSQPDEKPTAMLNSHALAEKPTTKEVSKHAPFIQLKADTCAICGSKVYQTEKFKVKDNIVHRSCIKCSVCKRLLSVGNFIMSQNKIYCKPHEPSVSIALST